MVSVMGIDPSLTGTGLASWVDGEWSRHTIVTKGSDQDTYHQTGNRLDRIVERVDAFRHDVNPDLVVIEHPAFSKFTGHAADRAGLFHLISRQIRLSWPDTAIAYADPQSRICYALGKFAGSKDTVMAAAIRRYIDVVEIRNNNEADAVLLCAMGVRWLAGQPGFPDQLADRVVPQTHLRGLGRVQWPLSLRP